MLRVSQTGLGQEEEAQNRWRAPPPAISPTPSTACQGLGHVSPGPREPRGSRRLPNPSSTLSCGSVVWGTDTGSVLNCRSGPCLGWLWGAPAHLGTGHGVLLGWYVGCGKGTTRVPTSVPDCPIQPPCLGVCGTTAPVPARVFAGLPARSWISVVGAAPQGLALTCRCPPATPPMATPANLTLGWGDGAG